MENLCVLTHLRDHLQAMGGQVVKGDDGASDWAGGSDEEDYSRFTYGENARAGRACCGLGQVCVV